MRQISFCLPVLAGALGLVAPSQAQQGNDDTV